MEIIYTHLYKKKDGTTSEYKRKYVPKGTKRTGRPLSQKGKLIKKINELSDEQILNVFDYISKL